MFYSITKTLSILPFLSYGLLALVWLLTELKCRKEQMTDTPQPEPARGGFIIPPGPGHEFYVSSDVICYLLRKGASRFRVYVIKGKNPDAKMKRDRYGSYFNVRANDAQKAEHIVSHAFGMTG